MKVITTQKNIDLENLAVDISSWLNTHNWDTDTKRAGDSIWKVIATKGGLVRNFLCTRGKISIFITKRGRTTEITIDDKSFNENWGANAVWVFATGGTNLLLTATGKIGAHNLTEYVESHIRQEQEKLGKNIRDYLYTALKTVSDDLFFTISQVIVPFVLSQTLSVPLVPILIASMGIWILRLGILIIIPSSKM